MHIFCKKNNHISGRATIFCLKAACCKKILLLEKMRWQTMMLCWWEITSIVESGDRSTLRLGQIPAIVKKLLSQIYCQILLFPAAFRIRMAKFMGGPVVNSNGWRDPHQTEKEQFCKKIICSNTKKTWYHISLSTSIEAPFFSTVCVESCVQFFSFWKRLCSLSSHQKRCFERKRQKMLT